MKLYIASKTKHAPRWRKLRDELLAKGSKVEVVCAWIDQAGPGETQNFEELWTNNIQQAYETDFLAFYHEPGETPKGSLMEVGAAMVGGATVILCVNGDPEWTGSSLARSGLCGDGTDPEAVAAYMEEFDGPSD